ncbi:MAG: SRPBCC domain-containing protein [Bacteroidota bacterium]|uniref:SRPBCC domain-containing protein n=1 Tax=Flagellimonas okinawensis TaxID=3031324 RepID=A0ABT5XJM7_9FLAO|nr:SRPBCC domain-containing protein [[Muricauda] okinawensis]MDF0706094.1 SRPBCC domain-containing protein [[Muricauda] okinawensis]MEC8832961.1 SRPBCC domain-containing protein [Bacteroidota bacterium]
MKKIAILLFHVFLTLSTFGQEKRVVSKIDSTKTPELVLIQELTVKASIDEVWNAYTTKKGWENWAAPLAEVDLKVGGFIKTNYNEKGKIGDSTTIVTHIINYVPKRLITLQAEITDNFPEFMKDDAKDFYNVIYFDELENGFTNIKSFGIGYKNNPRYLSLMTFFISANEITLINLIDYLEKE